MLRLALILSLGFASAAFAKTEKAIVAGGCFWCVESDFESVPGVISVVSGYTGGSSENPTYDNHEGHYEAAKITFDSAKITYAELIAKFLRSVDVTDAGGQFCDRGNSYRTAIFALDADQKATSPGPRVRRVTQREARPDAVAPRSERQSAPVRHERAEATHRGQEPVDIRLRGDPVRLPDERDRVEPRDDTRPVRHDERVLGVHDHGA